MAGWKGEAGRVLPAGSAPDKEACGLASTSGSSPDSPAACRPQAVCLSRLHLLGTKQSPHLLPRFHTWQRLGEGLPGLRLPSTRSRQVAPPARAFSTQSPSPPPARVPGRPPLLLTEGLLLVIRSGARAGEEMDGQGPRGHGWGFGGLWERSHLLCGPLSFGAIAAAPAERGRGVSLRPSPNPPLGLHSHPQGI